MVEEIKKDARVRMGKSIDALKLDLAKIRAGRAHTSLLDHVSVSYYGSDVALNQVASIAVSDARTLMVTPWEKKIVPDVEKAIMNSNLGLNPITAGEVIRVPVPALTEERRRDMMRLVRHEAENARVALRSIRRDANQHLKGLVKNEHLAKDAEHRAEDEIQKLTDQFVGQVDDILKAKEADLMEI